MRDVLRIAVVAAFAASALAAADRLAFDVASIRPNRGSANESSSERSGGRVSVHNVSFGEIIAFGYEIPSDRNDALLSRLAHIRKVRYRSDLAARNPSRTHYPVRTIS